MFWEQSGNILYDVQKEKDHYLDKHQYYFILISTLQGKTKSSLETTVFIPKRFDIYVIICGLKFEENGGQNSN